jgi:hypothetical protein
LAAPLLDSLQLIEGAIHRAPTDFLLCEDFMSKFEF